MRNHALCSLAIALIGTTAFAQVTGGAGGGGGGAGGAGGGTTGGFSGNFGANNTSTGGAAGTAGSTQGFSGNLDAPTAFGQTTGSTTGGAGKTTGIPTSINPFQAYYSNPQALGMQLVTIKTTGAGATTSTITAFGQPMYANATGTTGATGAGIGTGLTGNTGNFGVASYGAGATGGGAVGTLGGGLGAAGGGFGGAGGLGGAAGLGGGTAASLSYGSPIFFSTFGSSRASTYITTLGFTPPKIAPGRLQSDLQQVAARSEFMTSRNIQLAHEDGTVVLRGQVADERERRLAEGIVRLTPGVRSLRNELVVQAQP